MTEKLILEKLDQMALNHAQMEMKVDKIEAAVGLIAVQTERINNISKQINNLWVKYDDAFSTDGVINQVKNFQASCPRDQVKSDSANQWRVITLIFVVVTGCLLKVLGVV